MALTSRATSIPHTRSFTLTSFPSSRPPPSLYRYKRFTVRRYSNADRDGCNWHVDGCDLSIVIFVGGTCGEGDGGDLVLGDDDTPAALKRVVPREEQAEGSMVVFEGSKINHMVTQVTAGTRYAVVLFVDEHVRRACRDSSG